MTAVQEILYNFIGEIIFGIVSFILGYFMLHYRQAAKSSEGKPIMSPDKEVVAFEYDGEIWVKGKNLTKHPALDNNAIWSPDGRYLAFVSERDGNKEVYLVVMDTGKLLRVTDLSGNDEPIGWNDHGDLMIATQIDGLIMVRKKEIDERAKEQKDFGIN